MLPSLQSIISKSHIRLGENLKDLVKTIKCDFIFRKNWSDGLLHGILWALAPYSSMVKINSRQSKLVFIEISFTYLISRHQNFSRQNKFLSLQYTKQPSTFIHVNIKRLNLRFLPVLQVKLSRLCPFRSISVLDDNLQ
jgi:hypothetical protein